jgi:hypothetical protein
MQSFPPASEGAIPDAQGTLLSLVPPRIIHPPKERTFFHRLRHVLCFCFAYLFLISLLMILISSPDFPAFRAFSFYHYVWTPGGSPSCPVYLGILAIFKNEADYLPEWLEYHLLIGVERFWLVDNQSKDNFTGVLANYISSGIVLLSSVEGRWIQIATYNAMVPRLRSETFWLAIIDIDEFIVPIETHCLHQILHRYEHEPGIDMSLVIYGSNGQKRRTPGLVIERFLDHSALSFFRNRWTKTIMNPRAVRAMGVHQASYSHHRKSINPCGVRSYIPAPRRPPCHKILRVNHYRFKSHEEWIKKAARGGGTTRAPYNVSLIDEPAYEDVIKDDSIMDWYISRVKENLNVGFSFLPCHVQANPNYYDEMNLRWKQKDWSLDVRDPYSWMGEVQGRRQPVVDTNVLKPKPMPTSRPVPFSRSLSSAV